MSPQGSRDLDTAVRLAVAALATFIDDRRSLSDPFLPSALRFLRERKDIIRFPRDVPLLELFQVWGQQTIGAPGGERRYRWDLTRDAGRGERQAWTRPADQSRTLWRPAEANLLDRDPTGFGRRVAVPVVLTESYELLAECMALSGPAVATPAMVFAREARPRIESDISRWYVAEDPWRDTFGLWMLSRRPRTMNDFYHLAFGLAKRFGATTDWTEGVVYGSGFPFEGQPLTSATAHLAQAIWRLHVDTGRLPKMIKHLEVQQDRRDGGYHDPGQASDVLTTLAVADLLLRIDPTYVDDQMTGVERFFLASQEATGWWRALDPETPWLTAEIVRLLETSRLPFAKRFAWPYVPPWSVDRKTKVPTFDYFDDIASIFGSIPGLARSRIQVAFLDLAGFGEWNKAYGAAVGDRVLEVLTRALRDPRVLPDSRVVRDGGDEFLILGAPTNATLKHDLVTFLERWPAYFREAMRIDAPHPAPRIALAEAARGEELRAVRDCLGLHINPMKAKPAWPDGLLWGLDCHGRCAHPSSA